MAFRWVERRNGIYRGRDGGGWHSTGTLSRGKEPKRFCCYCFQYVYQGSGDIRGELPWIAVNALCEF